MLDANKARWIGGICVGIVIGEAARSGWGAFLLLLLGLIGRWLLSKVAGAFFDDEIDELRQRLFKDPIKRAIWRHARYRHGGRFRDCRFPDCNIF